MGALTQEDRNRSTWSKPAVQRELTERAAFIDAGESAALGHVLREIAGKPILDLGVGRGRTVPILMPLASEYRAIDYLPAMVDACHRAHPGVDVSLGDARRLDGCPAGHFGLVSFSYNGLDAMAPVDRRRVLAAVRRVLAPKGVFLFSTLNLDGPSFRERPWRPRVWYTRNPIRHAWQVLCGYAGAPLDLANWLHIRQCGERGPGYAVAPLSAHHFGVLAHYTTLERQLDELSARGFVDVAVFDNRSGRRLEAGDDTTCVDWFHVTARRR